VFELGFSEVLLVLIIALVVIGPERLPEVARGLGSMVGKVRRFIDNVRSDTDLHGEIAELRRQLDLSKEAAQLQQLGHTLHSDIQSSVNEIDYSIYNRPSTAEIQQQHREAAAVNAQTSNLQITAAKDEDADLANIQRPTFGREHYEELPPWYHQQSDGALLSRAPNIPEAPTAAPNIDTQSAAPAMINSPETAKSTT